MTGNIVGEPFDEYVQQQIAARQFVQFSGFDNSRTNNVLEYFTNRNAWVKLASSVKIENSSAGLKKIGNTKIVSPSNYLGTVLAQKAVLFNTLSEFLPGSKSFAPARAGVSNISELWNNNFIYGIGGADYGLQPPPGITGVQVDSLNRGSIRKANITLKAHNKFQFDIIELLYLRLGFTMMLEWGWDKYLRIGENTVSIEEIKNTIIEESWFTSKGYSQVGMLREIQTLRRKYSGNYDGFFGKVSNFTWDFKSDGSYDISIDLITIGDVIESLKVNTASKIIGEGSTNTDENEDENAVAQVESNTTKASYLNTIGYFLYNKQVEILNAKSDIYQWYAPGGKVSSIDNSKHNYYVIRPSDFVGERTIYANKDGNQVNQFYIRLKEFFAQLQTLVIPIIDNSLQLEFELDSCYMTHFPNQISFDPKVCIFRFPMRYGDIPTGGRGEEGVRNPASLSTTIKDPYLQILEEYTIEKTNGKYIAGDLMNIYVNFEFISGLLLQNGGPDQELSLFKFLQDLCNGINNALGGVNKLEPIIKDDHVITIIDQTFSSSDNNLVDLNVYGYNNESKVSNFVKDIKFVSKITPQLASMITIGATAASTEEGEEGNSPSEIEGTAFSKWSEGLTDRFSRSIKEPSGVKSLQEERTAEEEAKRTERITAEFLTYPPDGGDVGQSFTNFIRDNAGNAFAATTGTLGGVGGAIVGYFGKKKIDEAISITDEERKAYELSLRRLVPPGSIYQNLVGNGSYSLDEFLRLAKEFEDKEAARNVLPISEIENKIGLDYYLYLVNAFGGKMNKYRVPFRNKSDRSEEVISREYETDVARYLEFNDNFIAQGKSAYKIYINNLNSRRYNTQNLPSPEVGFIPLSFELILDGISGIKIYNKLNIQSEFLPSNYPESLKFVITKVNHNIFNNNWETSLSTISIPQTSEYEFGEFVTPITITNIEDSGGGRGDLPGAVEDAPKTSITSGISLVKVNGAPLQSKYKNNLIYVPQVTKKTMLVLHHTAGWPKGDKPEDNENIVRGILTKTWQEGNPAKGIVIDYPLCTHYIIQDGHVEHVFDEDYWSNHAASGVNEIEKSSISVEIGSMGRLEKNGNGQWITYTNAVIPENEVAMLVDKYGKEKSYRGFPAVHKYSNYQITELEKLIEKWKTDSRFKDSVRWEFDYDLMFPGMTEGKTITSPIARAVTPGVYSHNSFVDWKTDVLPQKELVDMLKKVLKDVTKY